MTGWRYWLLWLLVVGPVLIAAALLWVFFGDRINISFAWYDLWVGGYVDWPRRLLYLCPLPCLLIRVDTAAYYEIMSGGRVVGSVSSVVGFDDVQPGHRLRRIPKGEYMRLWRL